MIWKDVNVLQGGFDNFFDLAVNGQVNWEMRKDDVADLLQYLDSSGLEYQGPAASFEKGV